MASGLVKARWVAPYEAELPDKTVLVPNETVVEIGAGEAKDSENWSVVGGKSNTPRQPTVNELRAKAGELGLELPDNATKAEIQAAIDEAG